MHLQNETPHILFRFHEDTLTVSPPDSLEAMRHQASLHFSIVNLSSGSLTFSQAFGSRIELRLTVGEGGQSIFTPRDENGWGSVTCPDGFTCTGWTRHPLKKNRLTCILRPAPKTAVTLKSGLSLTFSWNHISSTALEGYGFVQALIQGVDGIASMTLDDTVFKKQVDTQIHHFFASPSTGAPGQEITLNWSIENADSGMLLPGGFDVLGPVPQRSFSRKVTLDEQIDRYYLNLVGNGAGVFEDAKVFMAPPVIDSFYIDSRNTVFWETHFASAVSLIQGIKTVNVNASGRVALERGVTEIILRCEGFFQVERKLMVPPIPEILSFQGTFYRYKGHQLAQLSWNTAGLSALSLTAWDTDSYTVSTEKAGAWEQVYPLNSRLTYGLFYRTADGRSQTVYIRNEVV